jgi:CDP-6-deoxy-D-xylo-4-hexulose-3-dehydrase
MRSPADLKSEILRLTREYASLVHAAQRPAADPARLPWSEGHAIPYAGRVFDENEVEAAVDAALDFWLTLGDQGEAFERELASFLGAKRTLLVNSGSSANLVAFAALTSHKLPAERRIRHGDEVITVAAGFPTTVAPIIQLGAVPVFVDSDPYSGNVRVDRLEAACNPGRTKAVMLAHALGNPFDIGAVLDVCRRHGLWLIEDNCDALGCTYGLSESRARSLGLDHLIRVAESGTHPLVRFEETGVVGARLLLAPSGCWGDLSTQSFYPPHHLTMGEGGAVNITGPLALKTCVESFRDWGRDCWCASGQDDTCGKRFAWQLGELPEGYDHKYTYSHLGFNLKPLDLQAAIGREQLKKLPGFIQERKRNWEILRGELADLEDVFEFSLPTHATAWIPPRDRRGGTTFADSFAWDASGCRTDASWFGFMLRVRATAPFTHTELARHLDAQKIGNRMFFGGNLLRQPAFVQLRRDRPDSFRVVGDLDGADAIMNQAIFLGTYPGLTRQMLSYEVAVIHDFVTAKRHSKAV